MSDRRGAERLHERWSGVLCGLVLPLRQLRQITRLPCLAGEKHTHSHTHSHSHSHTRIHASTHKHMGTHVHMHIFTQQTHKLTFTHAHTRVHTLIHKHTSIHTHTHTCTLAIDAQQADIHAYINTHTHTTLPLHPCVACCVYHCSDTEP